MPSSKAPPQAGRETVFPIASKTREIDAGWIVFSQERVGHQRHVCSKSLGADGHLIRFILDVKRRDEQTRSVLKKRHESLAIRRVRFTSRGLEAA